MIEGAKKKGIFILFTILVTFLFVLVLFILFFIFFFSNESNEPIQQKSRALQIQEIHISKKKTEYGIVHMNRELQDGEYVSYRNEKKSSRVVISNFDGVEYECSGECYLEDDEDRRSSTVLTRGLAVLVTAFSATVASQIAKEAFDDECVGMFAKMQKKKKKKKKVKSGVQQCTETTKEDKKNRYENVKYQCEGHCLDRNFKDEFQYQSMSNPMTSLDPMTHQILLLQEELVKEGGCEQFSTSGVIKVKVDKVTYEIAEKHYEEPPDKFAKEVLGPFCLKMSRQFVTEFAKKRVDNKKQLKGMSGFLRKNFCASYGDMYSTRVKHVNCVQKNTK